LKLSILPYTTTNLLLDLDRVATGNAVIERSYNLVDWIPYKLLPINVKQSLIPKTTSSAYFRVVEDLPTPTVISQNEQYISNGTAGITYFAVHLDPQSFDPYPPAAWEVTLRSTNNMGELPGHIVGSPVSSVFMWSILGDQRGQWIGTIRRKNQ
jgi:hypothetical protein